MIRLLISDDLFWTKLDDYYARDIKWPYNIDKLNKDLNRALSLHIITVPQKNTRGRRVMMDGDQEIIDWYSDGYYCEYEQKLKDQKKKWFNIYKEQLGRLLASKYLIDHPINGYD